MAKSQNNPVGPRAPTITLVVLSADAALAPRLRDLAAAPLRQPIEVSAAADPEAALAALAAAGRNGVVLYDLRGGNLFPAIPVMKRFGPVIGLIEDLATETVALGSGAADTIAVGELSAPLLERVLRHALERRLVDQQHAKLRLQDPVIGIPTQALFWEFLSLAVRRARRNKDFLALLVIDIDNLPDGEGTDGPYRDLALREMVARITPILRGSDTIARLESQQLAILAESMPRVEDVQIVAEKIIEEIERPLALGPGPAALDAAIGIALFPTSADEAEGMLARATDAMLQARERGRNRFAFA